MGTPISVNFDNISMDNFEKEVIKAYQNIRINYKLVFG